ncbi:uncharacterized protein OCT59_008946 [Rhizophagus irregularis]|uniref:Kinase-like domain-containing protein n=2 Tax=Rhizophagus irregularis TaxID=588596 RepID=U9UDL5_RHIID|nr:kinase-like domain-containing protein [Rhizophagus irregularis DAOM 181602=DAOM 197198]EXX68695.1 Cdc15p [Rhizophagus irregularis DAOM 197198w]POG72512.1 kinase-like domain-containing protein [Rhizophagus irregularis DAOM 181602=DAOM 197198]UZO17596.1 hypothetical protein OCT59_008946 [Rhizophagus irregularis]GBC24266.1 kinase-like domain-containing protein [Rhizophagus irregularis DAOM 181602=DAOM 197198]|eukprot:XP_025179378.1 kinase-like domain-containing protein [Rhizophagus irregularis DAOM 181602=DAOM 197198]
MDEFVPRKSKYCPDCYKHSRISFGWCKDCETDFMKGRFPYWSSGNRDVDELIRHTQLNSSQTCDYLEWIPFEVFDMVKYIGSGGFSSIYSALWMEGPRLNWDDGLQEWTRTGPIKVALKRLDNSINITSSYVEQIKAHHKCIQSASFAEMFGITMDPTSNYMLVMKYYRSGNLYQYLDRSNGILSWRDIIDMLWGIAGGLERIHTEGKVLKNLHGGNLLIGDEEISIDTGDVYIDTYISDVGLYGPRYNPRSSDQIYGVLPYVAPEVLRGENYSTASDIYSFGIIMYTLATGERPWYNEAHDINLAKNICDGKRLEIPEDTPKFYVELIRKCWDNEPEKRPTATYLYKKLNWINLILDPFDDDYYISEEKRRKIISQLPKSYTHPEIHPEAYYTSRLLYFPEL